MSDTDRDAPEETFNAAAAQERNSLLQRGILTATAVASFNANAVRRNSKTAATLGSANAAVAATQPPQTNAAVPSAAVPNTATYTSAVEMPSQKESV